MRNAYGIVMVIILISGFIGNVLIFLFLKYEKKLRSFTKTLFYAQACWDTLVLICPGIYYALIILFSIDIVTGNKHFENFFWYMSQLSVTCSLWTLSAMNIDRMCLLAWPTNARIQRVSYKEALLITFIYVLCNTIIFVLMCTILDRFGTFAAELGEAIIPLIILFFSSVAILYKLNFYSRQINPNSNGNTLQSSMFAVKMILVVGMYSFCVLVLVQIVNLSVEINFNIFSIKNDPYREKARLIMLGLRVLRVSCSAIKFYFYILATPHMRRAMKKIFV